MIISYKYLSNSIVRFVGLSVANCLWSVRGMNSIKKTIQVIFCTMNTSPLKSHNLLSNGYRGDKVVAVRCCIFTVFFISEGLLLLLYADIRSAKQ
jgi:hypothetical protein